jgi:uncharacterized spore protein YtfJ
MNVTDVLTQARDSITVQRVFGEPIDHGHVTVVPVARVAGGGGGGSAQGEKPGEGVGYGVGAMPAGVYVIEDDKVKWQPAVDVNRVILGGQIVAIVLLLTIRAVARLRARIRATALIVSSSTMATTWPPRMTRLTSTAGCHFTLSSSST